VNQSQDIFGKEALKNEDEAAGLIDDAVFVGLQGNRSFFEDAGNLSGYDAKESFILDFAVKEGYVGQRVEFFKPELNYEFIQSLGKLTAKEAPTERFRKDIVLLPENTIYSFKVEFQPNQSTFSEEKYGEEFKRALQQASLFGNAVVAIRGHGDPSWAVESFVQSGQKRGVVRQRAGAYHFADGRPFNPHDMKEVVAAINQHPNVYTIDPQSGAEDTTTPVSAQLTYLQKLSEDRAASVRKSVLDYAQKRKWRLDTSQIKSLGVGGTEPEVPWAHTEEETQRNRRVEFRIVRVPPAARLEADDEGFDF